MPEDALLDAPEVDNVESDASESVQNDSSGTETTNESSASETTGKETDSAPVISDANGQLKLSEGARTQLDKIKAENPKLAREMRAALFDRQTLLSKVPGGVKEALATIEAYEAEGGSEAVQAVKAENKLWQDLDADFQKADPKFVADIAEGNPEAFAKLAPSVMSKFAELNPEAFSYHVSKVFAQDMAANDIKLTMQLFRREIEDPDNPGKVKAGMNGISSLYNSLQSYIDRVNNMANTPPKTDAKTAANPTGATDLDQREQNITISEFTQEKDRALDSVTRSEFTKNLGTRKLTGEKISTVRELYEIGLRKLLATIPGHTAKVERFLAAKDKAGYRKHMEAAYKAKAPLAMAQAFRKAGIGGKPGPVAKQPAKAAATTAKVAPATGFTRSATKPEHNSVDWQRTGAARRTSADSNKYIMRDGSRVLYQR
jgi:hypothetical protein